MSALKHVTDAAHEIATERLASIRERTRALAEESEALKVECKRLSPALSKEAEDLWGALNTAASGVGGKDEPQANGRPPDEAAGESRNEELVERIRKREEKAG